MTEQKFDKDTYPTSLSLFNPVHAEFGFTIDGAALPHNAKLERYVTPEMDYLTYHCKTSAFSLIRRLAIR